MKPVVTDKAPGAIGPYSQGIAVCNLVFSSGQVGVDPATGKFAGDDAPAQAEQALKNIQAVLEEAGTSMDKVVKTTVFLTDMANFGPVNEVYGKFFKEGSYPARSCVAVRELPVNALVEIEVIARL